MVVYVLTWLYTEISMDYGWFWVRKLYDPVWDTMTGIRDFERDDVRKHLCKTVQVTPILLLTLSLHIRGNTDNFKISWSLSVDFELGDGSKETDWKESRLEDIINKETN